MLGVIAPFLIQNRRILLISGSILLILGGTYMKGRADCRAKYERAAAKIEAEWQEKVAGAAQDAYERGIAAAYADTRNEEIVDEIEERAAAEPGADDICLSADVVERLRALQ